jgi:hypothetical protein
MILQAFKNIKKVFTSHSKKESTLKVERAVDNEMVKREQINTPTYIGVPALSYLVEDPWFPPPVFSEKQLSVKEAHEQAVVDQQILDESESKESADIHQKLYEMATQNWTTVAETQGGSENFQEGPGEWHSGTGYNQFRN